MATTDITLARDERYMERIPDMAEQFARSNMCPDQFRGKSADIAVIAYSLAALNLRLSFPVLAQTYCVHGKPGLMAQLQSGLASRAGVDIHPIPGRCDDQSATVEVRMPRGDRYEVTFTMAEAERAGLTKASKSGEPSMYEKWPANMLVARATTRAISWYCPQVKLGMADAGVVDVEELDVVEEGSPPPDVDVHVPSLDVPSRQVPVRSVAPDGTTIPEHLREPPIDDTHRARLLEQLERLPEPVLNQIRDAAKDAGVPNLKTNRVTKAHGALMDRLITEAISTGGQTSETTPEVPVDQPEANRQLFDDEDPGRPF